MKIGVFVTFTSPRATPEAIRGFAVDAEAIGIDPLWMGPARARAR